MRERWKRRRRREKRRGRDDRKKGDRAKRNDRHVCFKNHRRPRRSIDAHRRAPREIDTVDTTLAAEEEAEGHVIRPLITGIEIGSGRKIAIETGPATGNALGTMSAKRCVVDAVEAAMARHP